MSIATTKNLTTSLNTNKNLICVGSLLQDAFCSLLQVIVLVTSFGENFESDQRSTNNLTGVWKML